MPDNLSELGETTLYPYVPATPAPTASDDRLGLVGAVLQGRYRVDAKVGEGGFGIVYRGFHLGFEQPIALKCLKSPPSLTPEEEATFLRMFRNEASTLYTLAELHTAIVRVHDLDVLERPGVAAVPFMVAMAWRAPVMSCIMASKRFT